MRCRRPRRVGGVRPRARAAHGREHRARDPGRGRSRPAAAPSSRARSRGSSAGASSSRRSATTRSATQAARQLADARHRRARACTAARRGAPGRTSTRTASGRSRCSATSSCRAGRCRSTATTPSSSSPATSRRCARRARRGFSRRRCASCPTLSEGGVPLDLLVGSLNDAGERYDGSLDAKIVVLTDGGDGGTVNGERFAAAPICPARSPTPTARVTRSRRRLLVGLARGDDVAAAVHLGARAGAAVITGQGPYTAQLTS